MITNPSCASRRRLGDWAALPFSQVISLASTGTWRSVAVSHKAAAQQMRQDAVRTSGGNLGGFCLAPSLAGGDCAGRERIIRHKAGHAVMGRQRAVYWMLEYHEVIWLPLATRWPAEMSNNGSNK